MRFRNVMLRHFLNFSGNWNNGLKARVSYLNSNNVTSNSNRNIGSQLSLGQIETRGSVTKQFLNLAGKIKRQKTILNKNGASNLLWMKALFFTLVAGELRKE